MSANKQDIVLRGENTKPLAQMLNNYAKYEQGEKKDSVLIYYIGTGTPNYICIPYYHVYHYNDLQAVHVCPSKEEVDKLLAMVSITDRDAFLKYVYNLYN